MSLLSIPSDVWGEIIDILPLSDLTHLRGTSRELCRLVDARCSRRGIVACLGPLPKKKPPSQKKLPKDIWSTTIWVCWNMKAPWLHHLCAVGKLDPLMWLLASGADPNEKASYPANATMHPDLHSWVRETPLMVAAGVGNAPAIKALLQVRKAMLDA